MLLHRRIALIFWSAIPALITLALLSFYLVPKHIDGLDSFMPLLPLIPMFYWGINDDRLMPYWFVFLVGLLPRCSGGPTVGAFFNY